MIISKDKTIFKSVSDHAQELYGILDLYCISDGEYSEVITLRQLENCRFNNVAICIKVGTMQEVEFYKYPNIRL